MSPIALQIYGFTLISAVVLGGGLALLGTQLAAKDRAMQTICMGQGAMLGVLLGLGLSQTLFSAWGSESYLPLPMAIGGAILSFIISEYLVRKKLASTNTHFAGLFAALLAGGYLVSALFPALENHMTQKYFGDLATLSAGESKICLALGSMLLVAFAFFGRKFTEQSFEMSVSGQGSISRHLKNPLEIISIVTICLCVQTVGYLFTIACFFLPTAFAARTLRAGLWRHLLYCALLSSISVALGFSLSLSFTNVPTVPAIIASMVLCGCLGGVIIPRFQRMP